MGKNIFSIFSASFLLVLVTVSSIGCSRLPVMESDSTVPYEYMGSIEVDSSPKCIIGSTMQLLTFGWLGQPKAEYVKKKLDQKLTKRSKTYNPDAIVNTVYSPAVGDPRFVQEEKVYAKGDMIRYKKAYRE